MGLDKIHQAVLSEATTEAARIVESARKKSAVFLNDQKTQTSRDMERLYNSRVQSIKDEFDRKLIQYKGMAGKQILEKRNAVLRSVFEETRETILKWPEGEYGDYMGRLIEKVAGNSGGRLRVHKDETGIFTKILSNINEKRNTETRIILDESNPLNERGGFIFLGINYEVDQTLGTILKDIEQEMLPVIAQKLFSE